MFELFNLKSKSILTELPGLLVTLCIVSVSVPINMQAQSGQSPITTNNPVQQVPDIPDEPVLTEDQTIEELQAQIAVLLSQVQILQVQLAVKQAGGVTCDFTRNLTVGSKGNDVTCLQNYLTVTGHFNYKDGATGYFGPVTRASVAAWQQAHGVIPPAGYFGPISRAKYQSLAQGTTVPITPPTPASTPPNIAPPPSDTTPPDPILPPPPLSGNQPILFNGIHYGNPADNNGPLSRAKSESLGLPIIPIRYNNGIDNNQDGILSANEYSSFDNWLSNNVSSSYNGPANLDYEWPFWGELSDPETTPERFNEIVDVYEEMLDYAQQERPAAQWGFFGIPINIMTSSEWQENGKDIIPLMMQSDAIFPQVYDCRPNFDNAPTLKTYVEWTLEAVQGERPIYPFIWPRHCGQWSFEGRVLVAEDELLAITNAALEASWIAPDGEVHRIDGIVVWDSFLEGDHDEIDANQAESLQLIHDLIESGSWQ